MTVAQATALVTLTILLTIGHTTKASTILSAADGNINILFGNVDGWPLALFDDTDFGGTALNLSSPPTIVGFTGPIGDDYLATNTSAETITLTDSNQFVLGVFNGSSWIPDAGFDDLGANAIRLHFETGGSSKSIVVVDVQATAVPIPAAFWLFGSGLLGLCSLARARK